MPVSCTAQEQQAAHDAAVAENQQRKAEYDAQMEEYLVASAGGISQQQLVRWYLETMVQRWAARCCTGLAAPAADCLQPVAQGPAALPAQRLPVQGMCRACAGHDLPQVQYAHQC
jgi:hypothetical protein